MTSLPGSSRIPVFGTVTVGPQGIPGITGIAGPTGNTGPTLIGRTGPTGLGISAANYFSSGISFTNYDSRVFYLGLTGPTGSTSDIFSNAVVARGLTTFGVSVIWSDVPLFEDLNQSVGLLWQDNEPLQSKNPTIRSLFIPKIDGISGVTTSNSYITITGKTFNFFPLGLTGEILYKSGASAFSINSSAYNSDTNLLSVPLGFDRYPMYNNQNIKTTTQQYTFSSQNISTLTGVTGFAFYTVNFGNFGIVNNNYQSVEQNKRAYTTLNLGVTGSDNLTFIFTGITFSNSARFIPQQVTNSSVGSCCFCNSDTTEIKCQDYVSSNYCSAVGGSFRTTSCLNRISTGDCYSEGACCVNNKCVNTSLENCIKYSGTFFPGQVCSIGNNFGGFVCPNTCEVSGDTSACCYRGKCFSLTRTECDAIPGARFLLNSDGTSIACPIEGGFLQACCDSLEGACCIKNLAGQYNCSIKTPVDCADGIFHGPGSRCEDVECCNQTFSSSYFTTQSGGTLCASNIGQVCAEIGARIGGGYFAGIIGMPSPCSSFDSPVVAYGQPLGCRVFPRNTTTTDQGNNYKNCGGTRNISQQDNTSANVNIEYFLRTLSSSSRDLSYQSNKVNSCLLKYGTPYVQQTYTDTVGSLQVTWPDNIQFTGSNSYSSSNGSFAYPIGDDLQFNYLISERFSSTNSIYKYLANTYYGATGIHVLWALIVAPDDAFSSQTLNWGMEEGRARKDPALFVDEPISSLAVDGLLSTRLFDETSKSNPRLWFRGTSSDPNAFDRFCFFNTTAAKRSNWASSVVENTIETNISAFQSAYIGMWDANNSTNTCTKQISLLNQNQYGGFNDWYIPSITELNYIHGNKETINAKILLGGGSPMQNANYWSSTSVCYLKNWSASDPSNYAQYVIDETTTSSNKNEKFRFTTTDYPNVSEKKLYELSMNTCAGENMLVQAFPVSQTSTDGLVYSKPRKTGTAKLRPVRRIPIIISNTGTNIESIIQNYNFSQCPSCPS